MSQDRTEIAKLAQGLAHHPLIITGVTDQFTLYRDRIRWTYRLLVVPLSQREMLYQEIQLVEVHIRATNHHELLLSKSGKNYHRQGEESPLIGNIVAITREQRILLLKLLELLAPQAHFNEAALQVMQSGHAL